MEILERVFQDVLILRPKVHGDHRGYFLESFNERVFEQIGIKNHFVQDNHSLSKEAGILRGMHFQTLPMAQAKLVRVITGKILDVVVDLRQKSPTFGQHFSIELSGENHLMLLVPQGFAHGFLTLETDNHVTYKVDQYYSKECNSGISWNDPDLNIRWPIKNPTLSQQDLGWKKLSETATSF